MEWLTSIRSAIDYIEEHIYEDINVASVAKVVYLSKMFLDKGFSVITGYTITEYIRYRRLYLAALELINTKKNVLDISLEFFYDTPESFTKAFTRFHGVTPTNVRKGAPARRFLPMHLSLNITGGSNMNYKITKMFPFKVIGFERTFSSATSQKEIPAFWDEICEKYTKNIYNGNPPANPYEKAVIDNCIGEYGICIDDLDGGNFRYLIAGKYAGGEVPEGMTLYEFPMGEWAVFDCVGPMPEALQALTNKIFGEWLPKNTEYELSGNASVEWYDCVNGETTDADYHSAVWLPIKRRQS